MKKALSLIIVLIMLLGVLTSCKTESIPYEHSPTYETQSPSAFLYNVDAQAPIYSKLNEEIRRPGSLAQLMTAVIVFELEQDIENTEILSNEDTFLGISGQNVPNIDIYPDETYTTKDLLYAVLLKGAYDASNLLAQHYGGETEAPIEAFVGLMNKKAAELNMTNTRYQSPSGIASLTDEKQTTNTQDTFLLVSYINNNHPVLKDMIKAQTYEIPQRTGQNPITIENRNQEVRGGSPNFNVDVQWGYISGYPGLSDSLITVATRNNLTYILVLMGANYSGTETVAADDIVYDVLRKTSLPPKDEESSGSSSSSSASSSSKTDEKEPTSETTESEVTTPETTQPPKTNIVISDPVSYIDSRELLNWAFNTISKVPYSSNIAGLGEKYKQADFSVTVEAAPELPNTMTSEEAFYLYMINPIDETVELKKRDVVGKAILAKAENSPSTNIIAVESDKKTGVGGFFSNLLSFFLIALLALVVITFVFIFVVRFYNIRKNKKRRLERQRRRERQKRLEEREENLRNPPF